MAARKARSLGVRFSDVLRRARGGEATARAALYRCYSSTILAQVARRLPIALRPKYDPMDIAQSVFADVLRHLPRIEDRGERAFVRLLVIKVENDIRSKLRRHVGLNGARLERRIATGADPPAASEDSGARADQVQAAVQLKRLLDRLDPSAREILRRRGEGQTFCDIAAAVGLASADAARKRHDRLITELRTTWKRQIR